MFTITTTTSTTSISLTCTKSVRTEGAPRGFAPCGLPATFSFTGDGVPSYRCEDHGLAMRARFEAGELVLWPERIR